MNSSMQPVSKFNFSEAPFENQYKALLNWIMQLNWYKIKEQETRQDRTGTGTYSVFNANNIVHELVDPETGKYWIPLLSSKYVHLPAIIHELIWMLSGSDRLEYLKENNVRIWDEWVLPGTEVKNEKGDLIGGSLGPVYGKQWRFWGEEQIDQVAKMENTLRNNPFSRRNIITAWNVSHIEQMALPPCHTLSQWYVREENGERYLDCKLYARSQDLFLGTPFNMAFYSIWTIALAILHGMKPGRYIHVFGDAHIYANHIDQVKEYLNDKTPSQKVFLDLDIYGDNKQRLLELAHADHGRQYISCIDLSYSDFKLEGWDDYKGKTKRIAAQVSV